MEKDEINFFKKLVAHGFEGLFFSSNRRNLGKYNC